MAKSKRNPKSTRGGSGLNNMEAAMRKAASMREEMMSVQDELATITTSGESSNGKVKVSVTGSGNLTNVSIDDSLLESGNSEIIEELILDAFLKATSAMEVITEEKMGPYASFIKSVG